VTRRLMLVLLALAALAMPRALAADAEVETRLAAAAEAFAKAASVPDLETRRNAFRGAAGLFEEALASGHQNGALEYNTANAWFLAGDTGRSILHYRRALRLRAGDPQFEENLAAARARRCDQIEDAGGRAFLETVFFWHRGLTRRTKVRGGLAAWLAAFLLLLPWAWRRRNDGRARLARRFAVVAFVVALALGLSAAVESLDASGRAAAVVLVDEVELRKGDGFGYPARYENPLHAGAEVEVLEERGGWVRIELPDGKDGWVSADSVERI